jgi:hypothetical protein
MEVSRVIWHGARLEMKGGAKIGASTISLGRLQYIRWVTAAPSQKTKTKVVLEWSVSL